MPRHQAEGGELIPDPRVADRYHVHPITIGRWDKDEELNFPAAIIINGRKYRRRVELEQWERSRVVARAAKQTEAA
jgi:hypothetical protein